MSNDDLNHLKSNQKIMLYPGQKPRRKNCLSLLLCQKKGTPMINLESLKNFIFQIKLLITQEFLQAFSLFHMIRAYSSAAYCQHSSTHPEFLSYIVSKTSNVKP